MLKCVFACDSGRGDFFPISPTLDDVSKRHILHFAFSARTGLSVFPRSRGKLQECTSIQEHVPSAVVVAAVAMYVQCCFVAMQARRVIM